MRHTGTGRNGERGTLLLVVVFLATAIAGLAALSSGRVVAETRHQRVMEEESRAFNAAYAQINMAMNVINNSAYDDQNRNLAIRGAMNGDFGGTIATATEALELQKKIEGLKVVETGYKVATELVGHATKGWLEDPEGVTHGMIENTTVRCYRARDYIQRLQVLKGRTQTEVDPFGDSDSYFVIEAAGRAGDTVRMVSALVRENEPFSSFVFFQNRATLGVSGAPRGLIHSNNKLAFYFPNGSYVDPVSAVSGFEYVAGATTANTSLRDANAEATAISLDQVDFNELKGKADVYTGEAGIDAEIFFSSNGGLEVRPWSPPRYDIVEKSNTYQKYVGFHYETVMETQSVKVGTQKVPYTEQVVDYYVKQPYVVTEQVQVGTKTETYYVTEQVQVGTKTETYYVTEQVQVGTKTVTKYNTVTTQTGTKQVPVTTQEPIYSTRTVTKYRSVKVWVPYSSGDAGGGTAVGGGGAGALGEWVTVQEPYTEQETYISGYKTVTTYKTEPVYTTTQVPYTVQEPVYETRQVAKTRTVPVYENRQVAKTKTTPIYEMQQVTKYKDVPVYKTVTKYKTVDVFEDKQVAVQKKVDDYETVTDTWTEEFFVSAVSLPKQKFTLSEDKGSTLYVDGRVLRMQGDLKGRLTVVGNESVRISNNIRYVDSKGELAMKNGSDYTKTYERNEKYTGHTVLGVIAREDVLFTSKMPLSAEINGTLMSVNGRVGVDGFWAKEDGELAKDSSSARKTYLTAERERQERAYDQYSNWRTKTFVGDSLRRIGGVISNNRIMETYVTVDKDGMSKVDAGFKRGNMKFDINLLFNPPPNFVEVPRPVLTYMVPVMMVRNNDA